MRTTKYNTLPLSERSAVTTEELRMILSSGKATATRIGNEAGAMIRIGRRVLWNTTKIQQYLDSISN